MKEFCVERIKYNGDREYRLSNKKLEQSEKGRYVQEILKKRFQNEVKEQFYSSAQIYPILGELMQEDTDLCEILKNWQNLVARPLQSSINTTLVQHEPALCRTQQRSYIRRNKFMSGGTRGSSAYRIPRM